MPLECGDLSPLFGQPAAPVRTESGDKSPHSKGAGLSRPLPASKPDFLATVAFSASIIPWGEHGHLPARPPNQVGHGAKFLLVEKGVLLFLAGLRVIVEWNLSFFRHDRQVPKRSLGGRLSESITLIGVSVQVGCRVVPGL